MSDADITTRLADMLVRCGIQRGVLGEIDADNLARILLPIVREAQAEAKAEVWALAASYVGKPFEQEFRERAAMWAELAEELT